MGWGQPDDNHAQAHDGRGRRGQMLRQTYVLYPNQIDLLEITFSHQTQGVQRRIDQVLSGMWLGFFDIFVSHVQNLLTQGICMGRCIGVKSHNQGIIVHFSRL